MLSKKTTAYITILIRLIKITILEREPESPTTKQSV